MVIALSFGCSLPLGQRITPRVTAEQQKVVSARMGISFPPETRFLLYHRCEDQPSRLPSPDDCIYLKIELPSSVAAGMLRKKTFAQANWSRTIRDVDDRPGLTEWQPSNVNRFKSAQIDLAESSALNVLVDEGHGKKTLVYLEWFEL